MLRYGRRSIYLHGLSVLVVLQLLIGILDCIPGRPAGVAWAESSLMLVWNFFYDVSVGPICFTLIGECSATRVRSKTIAVATAAQGVVGVAMTVAIPYMINPDQVRVGGKGRQPLCPFSSSSSSSPPPCSQACARELTFLPARPTCKANSAFSSAASPPSVMLGPSSASPRYVSNP